MMTEAEKIFWAVEQFTFAIKFLTCCNSGTVDPNIFKPKAIMRLKGVSFEIQAWNDMNLEKLKKAAGNQLMVSMAASAITVDDALSRVYGKNSFDAWKKDPSDLNSLREIIFLIRCAYAHTMPDVHWCIDKKRKDAIYQVCTPDGNVSFNAGNKQREKLKFNHFGGLKGYFDLVNFAHDLVRRQHRARS